MRNVSGIVHNSGTVVAGRVKNIQFSLYMHFIYCYIAFVHYLLKWKILDS